MEHKENPLEVSQDHLLMDKTNLKFVRAQDVKVGDVLSGNRVASISMVRHRGLYAPMTESETILVSSVTASCYVDFLSSVMMPTVQAHLSHIALTPLRVTCAMKFSLCKNETYSVDGFSSNLLTVTHFGLHLSTWNVVLHWLVVVLFSPILLGLIALDVLITKYLLLAFTVCFANGLCFYVRKLKYSGMTSI
jgi:hypothetical protein